MKLCLLLRMVAALTLPLVGVTSILSMAQVDAQRFNCASPVTTLDMSLCSSLDAKASDKKLNQIYAQLSLKLAGQQRQRLVAAQQAWIKFRDASCAYESGQFEGGTLAPVVKNSCIARVTRQRTQDLENYLQDVNRR